MNCYLGIDIGGTKTAYGLFDESRTLLKREQTPSDMDADGPVFFSGVADRIRAFMEEARSLGGSLEGVGIGITGFVDFERGALTRSASLPKLNYFCVVDYLKSALHADIPIVMDNDCHCGALAEYRHGAGRGHRHMLYCPVSTGISTGIIIDGKLFRGSNGASGESGHMLSGVRETKEFPAPAETRDASIPLAPARRLSAMCGDGSGKGKSPCFPVWPEGSTASRRSILTPPMSRATLWHNARWIKWRVIWPYGSSMCICC